MKLYELQLSSKREPLSELKLSKEGTLSAVAAARETPEYKKLADLLDDVSTDRQRANGTFVFTTDEKSFASGSYKYIISVTGKISYGASVMNKVSAPLLTPDDQVENYRRQFQRVIDLTTNTSKKRPDVRTYADEDKEVSSLGEGEPFVVVNSNIKSLKGAPKVVSRINLTGCKNLTSLEHLPALDSDEGTVMLDHLTSLTSLKGVPAKVGNLRILTCPKLTSLEGVSMKADNLVLDNCKGITSLAGIGHKYLKQVRAITLQTANIKSHVLGLMLIENLEELHSSEDANKKADWFHLARVVLKDPKISKQDRALELQEMLIRNNLSEYAEL